MNYLLCGVGGQGTVLAAKVLAAAAIAKGENVKTTETIGEFGGTSGIVTVEDLVEEIFGDIEDEHDNQNLMAKALGENEYLLSGRLEIERINEMFGIDLPESDEYQTLGGLILVHHKRFPQMNETINVGKFRIRAIKLRSTKIELVKLTVAN